MMQIRLNVQVRKNRDEKEKAGTRKKKQSEIKGRLETKVES